jgi:hypothetical protein
MFELPSRSAQRKKEAARKPPPNYLSRREQMRLLVLVGALMLVVILMIEASKPKNWQWMWAKDPHGLTDAEIADKKIDTLLPPRPNPVADLDPDVFVSPLDEPSLDDVEQADEDEYFEGVDPKLLATVRDDMLLRPAEAEAWYHLWVVLKNADADKLEEESLGRMGFVQLFEQAEEYRGRLVTIRGTVRQAAWVKAYDNPYGIEGYWECWLRPAGGPDSPIIVYALEMPEGFPSGENLREDAAFTGFSYKRKAYQAKGRGGGGETRTAPLVMAKIGQWTPPPPKETPRANVWIILVAVTGTALIAAGIAMFVYLRSGSVSPAAQQYSTLGKAEEGELAALERADLGPDVHQKLSQIAGDHDRGDNS